MRKQNTSLPAKRAKLQGARKQPGAVACKSRSVLVPGGDRLANKKGGHLQAGIPLKDST